MNFTQQLTGLITSFLVLGCSSTVPVAKKADGLSQLENHSEKAISKISFGSCNNPARVKGKGPAVFDALLKRNPDVFIFLGDNIYGDTEDMNLLKKKYQKLEAVANFRALRDSSTLLATWDDHDFGVNDGGNTYPKREESEKVFLDFFKDSEDSPRRQRPGVYGAYTFGSQGQRCQILVLDTRFFRDVLPKAARKTKAQGTVGWYEPTKDTSKTLLGQAQWDWLEEQLQVPADVRIIASSIQLLAFEKGMENWGNVPHEQQRLFNLLKKYKCDNTLAISGDVHFTELSKKDIGGYPFYDFTSSGITHTGKSWSQAANSFRVGESSYEKNVGVIEIDWSQKKIRLEAVNGQGKSLIEHSLSFKDLTFNK